jgi:GIY-YIG catalytic domain
VVLSYSDVIETLYGLVANKGIKDYHHTPESLHVPGIYCFLSKDGLSFYIGSSLNMHTRYTRHLSNLNQHSNKRNYEASPKFYNYIRKHGLDNLSFCCLLVIKNYHGIFTGFNVSKEETSFLTLLMQLDLLITE